MYKLFLHHWIYTFNAKSKLLHFHVRSQTHPSEAPRSFILNVAAIWSITVKIIRFRPEPNKPSREQRQFGASPLCASAETQASGYDKQYLLIICVRQSPQDQQSAQKLSRCCDNSWWLCERASDEGLINTRAGLWGNCSLSFECVLLVLWHPSYRNRHFQLPFMSFVCMWQTQ